MRRCLIVDDSAVVRKVTRRILNDSGLLVGEAATGTEALDICTQEMPEIIIVDSLLPDRDSIELIGLLYNLNPDNRPFIVLNTHEIVLTQIMKARRAGAKEHMLKPFTRQQLLDCFRKFNVIGSKQEVASSILYG